MFASLPDTSLNFGVQFIVSSASAMNFGHSEIVRFSRRQILDSSKLKELADNNFKFDENGRKLSKWVENTVGKGEIARYKQFLLFSQRFQKACFPGASKGVIVLEWVKEEAFLKTLRPFLWKWEKNDHLNFLFLSQTFLLFQRT